MTGRTDLPLSPGGYDTCDKSSTVGKMSRLETTEDSLFPEGSIPGNERIKGMRKEGLNK